MAHTPQHPPDEREQRGVYKNGIPHIAHPQGAHARATNHRHEGRCPARRMHAIHCAHGEHGTPHGAGGRQGLRLDPRRAPDPDADRPL